MNDPTVTAVPTEAVFAGLDWASTDHAVCILDAAGTVLWRHTVSHSRVGLSRLTTRLGELGVSRVGIERPDGPVVEALLNAGLRVAVAPPRQVKNLRSGYTRAGKDDRFDAYVLADAMRTDGHRFTDLTRDSAATIGLRALVRARQDLVEIRVGLVNQLRHILELAFPGAVGLFFDLHSPIARAFLRRLPTAAEAALLNEETMAAWLTAEGYCGRTPAAVFIDRLRTAPAGLAGAEAAARRHVTLALLDPGPASRHRRHRRAGRRAGPPHQGGSRAAPGRAGLHQPARAGQVRAAALLAEIGDARGRYPPPTPSPRPPGSARSPMNPANTAPSASATRSTPNSAGH
jgi:transposase